MMHGRRLTPLPHQWQAQMQAAATGWGEIRKRHEAVREGVTERLRKDWEGIQAGDVVILSAAITAQSYGVQLCDDDGETILIDGTVLLIEDGMALVRVSRLVSGKRAGKGRATEETHWVKRNDIDSVSDKPAMVWGDGDQAARTAQQRDGRRGGDRSSFWST